MQVSMVCVFVCFIYLLLNENESSRKFRFLYVYLSIYWFGCSSANLFNGIILSLILSPNSRSPQKHILTNSKLLIRKKKKERLVYANFFLAIGFSIYLFRVFLLAHVFLLKFVEESCFLELFDPNSYLWFSLCMIFT